MNRLGLTLGTALALALAGCNQAATETAMPAEEQTVSMETLETAVANAERPEPARALDESRKPAEVLAFLGLKSGDAAADLVTGGGYWAEILAGAVGESGSVTAIEPEQFYDEGVWNALKEREPGIALETYRMEKFDAGSDRFDFAILNLTYHDAYWESEEYDVPRSDPKDFLAAVYKSLKPGGIIGVVDHVGPSGDTREIVQELHRIDPAVAKKDFENAGFELVAQSDMLANAEDDHTKSVFDPEIRGKTDRFIMKFRKPSS